MGKLGESPRAKRVKPKPRFAGKKGRFPEGARLPAKGKFKRHVQAAETFHAIPDDRDKAEVIAALGSTPERAAELYDVLVPRLTDVVVFKLRRDSSADGRLKRKKISSRLQAFLSQAESLQSQLSGLSGVDKTDLQMRNIRVDDQTSDHLRERKISYDLKILLKRLMKIKETIDKVQIAPNRPSKDDDFDEHIAEEFARAWCELAHTYGISKGNYYEFLNALAGRFRGSVSITRYVKRRKNLPPDQTYSVALAELHGPIRRAIKLTPARVRTLQQSHMAKLD